MVKGVRKVLILFLLLVFSAPFVSAWWLDNYTNQASYSINTTSTIELVNFTIPLIVDNNIFWIRQPVQPPAITNGTGLIYNNSLIDYRFVNSSDNQEYAGEVEKGGALNRTNGQGSAWDNFLTARWGGSNTRDSIGARHLTLGSGVLNSTGIIGGDLSFQNVGASFDDIDAPTNAITIMTWVKKYDVTTENNKIIGVATGSTAEILIYYYSTAGLGWACNVYTGGDNWFSSSVTTTANIWNHVALRYDGNNAVLFLNGEVIVNFPLTGNMKDSNSVWTLGGEQAGGDGYYFSGDIDEARVYTGRNLSNDEIRAIYESQKYNYVNLTSIFSPAIPNPFMFGCSLGNNPYIDNNIKGICKINNTDNSAFYYCNSFSYDINGTLINANPKKENVEGIGGINYFKSFPDNKSIELVNVEFDKNNLLANQEVNLKVICVGNSNRLTFNQTIIPIYKGLTQPVDLFLEIKDNAPYILGFLLLIGGLIWLFLKIKGVF